MRTYFRSAWRAALIAAGLGVPVGTVVAAPPVAGPNVNMVQGTKWPEGDPFLTKQNEPSIAISSRNARHLLAGSNDYRLVPVEIAEELDDPEAWIQIYKSIDGGATWRATPLGGCPINIPECNDSTGLTAPLKAKHPNFGADPTARAGPYGTFFLSFIAGTRDTSSQGVVAVQRFVDKNNDIQRSTDLRECSTPGTGGCATVHIPDGCTGGPPACTVKNVVIKSAEDPILPDVLNLIDVGTPGQGKDKPWIAVDVGRRSWNGAKTCELLSWTKNRTDVANAAETVGAFNVYVSYANFTGNSNKPDIYVAVSSDCGKTFGKAIKISSGGAKNQGTSSAIDPLTGAVYIVWRGFFIPATSGSPAVPDQILMSKSTDGGKTWSKPTAVVSTFNPYDQGSTGVSIRTLDFPSVAVSIDKTTGASRVHVAWSQRKVAPSSAPPTYACPSTTPADCDARIVVATSTNGGTTFGAPVAVDSGYTVNLLKPDGTLAYSHSRGHQIQASLTFAAGKLLATWLDSREDHSQGVLVCPAANPSCPSVSERIEVRRAAKNSNLDNFNDNGGDVPGCHIDVSKLPPNPPLTPAQKETLNHCFNPAAVWTTYMTDGSPGLVRRHTLDTYSAMADPADSPNFQSSRVSRYTFGNTAQTAQGTYEIVQKEISPQNLPMFSNAKGAFIGDYIDSAGQLIVATGDVTQPYKFNAGVTTNGAFVTGGFAPVFHVAFTDNRDVIPPLSGDWTTPACQTTDFTKDANGNITGVKVGTTCGPGYAGNRNQNVYTAAIAENSVAFAGANSKLLDSSTPRNFVVTVRNLTDTGRWYALTIPAQPTGGRAAFKTTELPSGTVSPAFVFVQPKSSAARAVWAKASNGNAKVTVLVQSLTGAPTIPPSGPPTYTPDNAFTTQVFLNPDANAALVKNGDGTGPLADTAIDNVGNVVLSNAVLTNNALSNNVLTNNALSNNALTNAVLSNVVLSNVVLSNLDPANAVLSNDPLSNNALTNNALSNVVLSNAVLSNNALSNAVLSNVVLSNNALNAALTNLDPANVALSNAVLSNNALTNVVLSNLDPNNALSNAMLTNNALTNAVLSNVVLSNNALSNNALSNNVLSNVVLSNAPLGDAANGGDPDALSTIETGAVEIAKNSFQTGELANSNFKETTFTIRNRGNTDTILAIKLMLRDAVCSGAPNYTCTPPVDASGHPLYKLQLVLRKVALVPVAIPPTGPAVSTGRSIRIGIAQANTEVSNVSDLPLIDPDDSNFGKFLPDDPKAAMLSLAAGEYAYATIRAIGVGGTTPPDPAELLRWGVKTVATNSTNANGPLVIRTLNFTDTFVALTPATPTFRTFGGVAPISGSPVCADNNGTPYLTGTGAPENVVAGGVGNFYIDAGTLTLYGPKAFNHDPSKPNDPTADLPKIGWGSGTSLISSVPRPGDPQTGPHATLPCPLPPTALAVGAFATDASFNSTATVTFTPKYWGDFYVLANVNDATSPAQTDRQVIKVTVQPHPTTVTFTPSPLVYNNNGAAIDLRSSATSDRLIGTGVLQPIVFSATGGACHLGNASDSNYTNYTLFIDYATGYILPSNQPATCVVTANQAGNEIYAPAPANSQTIFIDRATQVISFTPPADNALQYQTGNAPATLVASVTSPTAPPSGIPVTFNSTTTGVCTTGGTNGATLSLAGAGPCSVVASVGGDANYKPAVLPAMTFQIAKADQNIALVAPASAPYNASFMVSATSTSPTAPPSGITITFGSSTTSVCTVSGATVSIVTVGTCTITANQGGNGDYNAAPQVYKDITITKADQAIVFGAAPSLTFGDSPGTVSATSSSLTAPPSGTAIIFSSQTTGICTTGGVNGSTVTIVAAGSCTIAADQASSTNYNAAPQVLQSFNIAKAPVQFTVDPLYFTSFGDPTTTVTGKLSRPGFPAVFPPDAPTIAVAPNSTTLTSGVPGGTDGTFTATGTTPASDTYSLTFSYAASTNFQAATATSKLRVEGFSSAGTMTQPRARHRSVLLDDGRVLIAGGFYTNAGSYARQDTSEVYCPDTLPSAAGCPNGLGAFGAVGNLHSGSDGLTLTKLLDGRVLKVGGKNVDLEIFDPATNAWTLLLTAALPQPRAFHQATLLTCTSCSYNGKVLITGGDDGTAGNTSGNTIATTLIFDPATNTLSPGPDMITARDSHSATALVDGRVLIAGGEQMSGPSTYVALKSAEIFDPTAAACAPATFGCMVAEPDMTDARFSDGNVLLGNGKVLIAGGSNDPSGQRTGLLSSAEIYDPGTNTWAYLSPGLNESRRAHSLTMLYDGWALAVGGMGPTTPVDIPRRITSELFDPVITQFDLGPTLTTARARHRATLLLDGRVLITGGTIDITPPNDFVHRDSAIDSAEFYNSGPP